VAQLDVVVEAAWDYPSMKSTFKLILMKQQCAESSLLWFLNHS